MSVYGVVSFFCSPIVATLSDSVGRKPIMVISALTDSYTTIICGLFPSNVVYILMMAMQGAGDTSQAVGLSLLADCVAGTPKGYYGSEKDNWMCQTMYKVIRSKGMFAGAAGPASSPIAYSPLQISDDVEDPSLQKIIGGGGGTAIVVEKEDDDYIQHELNTQFTVVLFLQTSGLLAGIGCGDLMYHFTQSYKWSIAFGGIICAPCMLYLLLFMPETISYEERKPFSVETLIASVTSQVCFSTRVGEREREKST
jgi:MFS family permease